MTHCWKGPQNKVEKQEVRCDISTSFFCFLCKSFLSHHLQRMRYHVRWRPLETMLTFGSRLASASPSKAGINIEKHVKAEIKIIRMYILKCYTITLEFSSKKHVKAEIITIVQSQTLHCRKLDLPSKKNISKLKLS